MFSEVPLLEHAFVVEIENFDSCEVLRKVCGRASPAQFVLVEHTWRRRKGGALLLFSHITACYRTGAVEGDVVA